MAMNMPKYSTNVNYQALQSRISPEETQDALNKLLYEINQRTNEYLFLCTKEDLDYSSKLPEGKFRDILNKFTIYPSTLEKEIIIHKYTINDSFIDYIHMSKLLPQYKIQYIDPLLHHLNTMNKKIDNKDMTVNTTRIGKIIDLSPLERLNCQLNEENFMIKNAKNIMTNIMTKSAQPAQYMNSLLQLCDFDRDNKLTIGEISLFLEKCDIFLSEYDLRFFFEYFPRMGGKIPIETFETYIDNSYQKKYEQTARTEFISKEAADAVLKQEDKDEKYYDDIMKKNYLISIIKECLLIFGQAFLMKYFSKHFEFSNNNFYIIDEQLVIGFKALGYKEVIPNELGNFKLLCVNKSIGVLNIDKNIKINVELLFNYIIDYFQMTKKIQKCTSDEIVKGMSVGYFKLMNEVFLNTVTDKINNTDLYKSQLNEFEFRKKFIQSFGFIDHDFFDYTIKNLGKEEENFSQMNNSFERGYVDHKTNIFSLKKIEAKNYIELAYNIVFMSMIHNYANIGLAIDDADADALNLIYNKMERKIFQQPRIQHDTNNKNLLDTYGMALPKKVFEAKYAQIEPLNQTSHYNTIKPSQRTVNDFVIGNYRANAVKIEEEMQNIEGVNKITETQFPIAKVIQKPKETILDPIIVIPKLFQICKSYLLVKYKIQDINHAMISNVGICRIFRDELIKEGVDIKSKIHLTTFLLYIKNIISNEEIIEFITEMVKQQKDPDGLLNIQFFFSKIEEILLQYCKAYEVPYQQLQLQQNKRVIR